MSKLVYTWGKVQAGDIISFRYKGKKSFDWIEVRRQRNYSHNKKQTNVSSVIGEGW